MLLIISAILRPGKDKNAVMNMMNKSVTASNLGETSDNLWHRRKVFVNMLSCCLQKLQNNISVLLQDLLVIVRMKVIPVFFHANVTTFPSKLANVTAFPSNITFAVRYFKVT